jgi:hypothetical protein
MIHSALRCHQPARASLERGCLVWLGGGSGAFGPGSVSLMTSAFHACPPQQQQQGAQGSDCRPCTREPCGPDRLCMWGAERDRTNPLGFCSSSAAAANAAPFRAAEYCTLPRPSALLTPPPPPPHETSCVYTYLGDRLDVPDTSHQQAACAGVLPHCRSRSSHQHTGSSNPSPFSLSCMLAAHPLWKRRLPAHSAIHR